jgi:hypothetical protein
VGWGHPRVEDSRRRSPGGEEGDCASAPVPRARDYHDPATWAATGRHDPPPPGRRALREAPGRVPLVAGARLLLRRERRAGLRGSGDDRPDGAGAGGGGAGGRLRVDRHRVGGVRGDARGGPLDPCAHARVACGGGDGPGAGLARPRGEGDDPDRLHREPALRQREDRQAVARDRGGCAQAPGRGARLHDREAPARDVAGAAGARGRRGSRHRRGRRRHQQRGAERPLRGRPPREPAGRDERHPRWHGRRLRAAPRVLEGSGHAGRAARAGQAPPHRRRTPHLRGSRARPFHMFLNIAPSGSAARWTIG